MKLSFTLPKSVLHFLRPLKPLLIHHYFILITILLLVVITTVYMVNLTFQSPSDEAYRDEKLRASTRGNFDQATIDKIERLQRSDQPGSQPDLPAGARINPFSE